MLATAVALAAAGCGDKSDNASGSGGGSSSPTTTAAAKPAGTPFKVMVDSVTGSPIASFPGVYGAAKAAAKAVNDGGGVNGHPIEIVTCNNQLTPNGAAACGRKAVSEKVAAYAGFEAQGPQIYPLLKKAGIPSVNMVQSPADAAAPLHYPISSAGVSEEIGLAFAAAKAGAKTAALVLLQFPGYEAIVDEVKAGAAAAGVNLSKVISIPATQNTYDSVVANAKGAKTDAVLLSLGPAQTLSMLKAAQAVAFRPKWVTYAGALQPEQVKQLGQMTPDLQLTSGVPPADASSFAGIKTMNAELDAAGKAGVSDTGAGDRSEGAIDTWLQIHALADVAKGIKGDITAASLLRAIQASAPIKLYDITTWDPASQGPKPYPSLRDGGAVYFGPVKDGTFQPAAEPLKVFDALKLQ
ncbi:MAG TPA: ABC transporter substrate-binding protein [Baekduia sp.]|uniref:ABC transporter substrate-binding protein n=1 Tax=Baekduia sp. TaxID=2600305 RepID=UPI002D797B7A|nr:ABC transporter substrate-binding protein [Baekduia sp.]HET6509003.1 ABC transporter substrate-binding protein [Baekduia sp.]